MATRMTKAAGATEEVVEKVVEKPTPVINHSDYVLCHSIISGGLHINCKSGNTYDFKDYGSECEIEYRDLVALTRKSSDHIFLPRIIIDDEDFLNEFPRIRSLYESMYTTTDLREILNLPNDQMAMEITKLPDSVKETVKRLVSTDIANGTIDSVRKIRILSDIFESDFNLLSQLFSK